MNVIPYSSLCPRPHQNQHYSIIPLPSQSLLSLSLILSPDPYSIPTILHHPSTPSSPLLGKPPSSPLPRPFIGSAKSAKLEMCDMRQKSQMGVFESRSLVFRAGVGSFVMWEVQGLRLGCLDGLGCGLAGMGCWRERELEICGFEDLEYKWCRAVDCWEK